MNKEELFDECVKEAIKIGRKYLEYGDMSGELPTQQEWDLALILFENKLFLGGYTND